jgi:hypothetical protein
MTCALKVFSRSCSFRGPLSKKRIDKYSKIFFSKDPNLLKGYKNMNLPLYVIHYHCLYGGPMIGLFHGTNTHIDKTKYVLNKTIGVGIIQNGRLSISKVSLLFGVGAPRLSNY